MAKLLLLTGLPDEVNRRTEAIADNNGFKVKTAGNRDECQEILQNSEVVALVIYSKMISEDSRLLDVLRSYSNKVQIIVYIGEGMETPEQYLSKPVAGIIQGNQFPEEDFLLLLNNAQRLYQLEEKIESLDTALRDNQSIASELDLKNKVLERERNFNDSIISAIAYGLLIVDTEGSIMLLNEMGKKVFGIKVSDFYGMNYEAVIFEEIRDSLTTHAREVLKTGKTKEVEGFSISENLVVSYSISVIKDNFENTAGLIFLGRDITDWEHMTTQLFQTEKLVTMGTMLSGIAHELRNPMTIINARAQRMLGSKKEELTGKQKKAVESIEYQSKRCGEIVNNLLDFSRKKVAGIAIVNINEIIESTLEFLALEGRSEGIQVIKKFDERCMAKCDKNQMEQVFLNLFTNAWDAMEDSGKLILTTENRDAYIRITVRDNGPGIPEEHKKKIFDPFFTTKEAGRGTGLGLALVYKYIQMHKGRLVLQSKAGEGTTFIILLPKA
jgi:PAS domain S-box-containing protein